MARTDRARSRIDVVEAVEAAGIGLFDWDLQTDKMTWDLRLTELFGVDSRAFTFVRAGFLSCVHPADVRRVDQALGEALETCGEYSVRYRVRRAGAVRWVVSRGRVIPDESGHARRFVGCAYDATALVDVDATIARVLEEMPTAFITLDRAGRFVYLNATAESLLGATRADLGGARAYRAFASLAGSLLGGELRNALREGHPVTLTAHCPAPLGGWYEIHAWPGPQGLSLHLTDLGERVRAQEELAAATHHGARASSLRAYSRTPCQDTRASRGGHRVVRDVAKSVRERGHSTSRSGPRRCAASASTCVSFLAYLRALSSSPAVSTALLNSSRRGPLSNFGCSSVSASALTAE